MCFRLGDEPGRFARIALIKYPDVAAEVAAVVVNVGLLAGVYKKSTGLSAVGAGAMGHWR